VPFAVGDLIDGHYRVEQRFAGGMGFVYIVLDEVVSKRFAIKQLSELHAENKILRERFRREASTWLLLDYHPHIVQAHSYLPRIEAPMLILEYVDGPSVDRLLRAEKRLCTAQVIAYARQFCLAMQHAHDRVIPERGVGVLHRDIKPGNLLLTRTNQIKVTDFGLAKIQGDTNLTTEGQFLGTVAYSPPEQLRGAGDVTKASDVYSFGAVMYQMLTGRQPFRGSNPGELYYAVHETAPRSIRELNPEVDTELADIVLRCLCKAAGDRFADFLDLERAINDVKPTVEARAPCNACGFISTRLLTKCSVCGNALDEKSRVPSPKHRRKHIPAWKCACGADVPANHSTCPQCELPVRRKEVAGLSVAASACASPDSDAPLPVCGLSDSTPACQGEQKSAWNLDAEKDYLVEIQSNGNILPWPLERSGYTLGRAENMKIRIDDPHIARYQMFLVRLPCGWLAINPQLSPALEVNGWTVRQRVLRPGDLLRIGNTWLAFAGPGTSEPLTPIPGRWSERAGSKELTVRGGGSHTTVLVGPNLSECTLELAGNRRYTSRGQPLRIGSSPICEVRIDNPSVAPVHALVAWQLDGAHLIKVANLTVRQVGGDELTDRLLKDGDLLQIGDIPIRARVEGDVSLPGRRWAQSLNSPNRFALTILTGPQRGQMAILPFGESVTLGRHTDCDAFIASDSFISRRHIQITAGESEIDFKDLGSRGGFFLNQAHCTATAVARLGDVVVIGKTSLLVHHQVEAD
jgi:serine/threonine protein kinase/pSer/pThr/pTyr-binding forkhead associated (FHA) protein